MAAKQTGRGWLRRLTKEGPRDRGELVDMIRAAARGGIIDADAFQMIQGVLRVADQHVRDIMVPRSQMVVLERDSGAQKLLPAVIESGHSRFPVIGDDRDQIVGILLAKDLLRYFSEGAMGSWDIREVLRPVAFVPESKRLNVLLKEFRASNARSRPSMRFASAERSWSKPSPASTVRSRRSMRFAPAASSWS